MPTTKFINSENPKQAINTNQQSPFYYSQQQNNLTQTPTSKTHTGTLDSSTKRTLELKPPSTIMNLSTLFTPTIAQTKLLEKELTFIPYHKHFDKEQLHRDLYFYHRRLKLIDYFQGTDSTSSTIPFTKPSNWEPESTNIHENIHKLIQQDQKALNSYTTTNNIQDNLSQEERRALKDLKTNPNIIIKLADKGSNIVIMDQSQYLIEAHRQLNNTTHYKSIPDTLQLHIQPQIRTISDSLYQKKFITHKQKDFLYGPDQPRLRQFYLLPKIHKDPATWTVPNEIPTGRPIVSDCKSTSYNIAMYIDHFLGPLSTKHPSYLKDTYHFLDIIKSITVPTNSYLFTIDIDSLYTNIETIYRPLSYPGHFSFK